jgi:uncharacterized protein (DUF4213/DUF364 family)
MNNKSINLLMESLDSDYSVQRVIVGAFWTAVLLDSEHPNCGIASSMREYDHQEGPQVEGAGFLENKTARELSQLLYSTNVMEASIGMAAFNATVNPDSRYCTEENARELILQKGQNRNVAVIGHFPFVDKIYKAARNCWVLELRPKSGDLPADRAKEILPKAEVIAISGTTLINHTFDDLMKWCESDAFVILLGGSAPLTPVLFELGVNAIAGTYITEPEAAIRVISQGGTFRQIPGRKLFTMLNRLKG